MSEDIQKDATTPSEGHEARHASAEAIPEAQTPAETPAEVPAESTPATATEQQPG